MTEENSMSLARRISVLLAGELLDAGTHNEFGVVVRDIKPIDYAELALVAGPVSAKRGSATLRVALVDQEAVVEFASQRDGKLRDVLTSSEEKAVQWRNDRLRTIAVISERPLSKAASLRDFRVIKEADLIKRYCAQQAQSAEVTWLRTLWNVLGQNNQLRIGLVEFLKFGEELAGALSIDRSVRAPLRLHLLGLLPDSHLADEKTDRGILKRLLSNREFADQIRRASNEDWSRIRQFIRTQTSDAKSQANRLLRGLKESARSGRFDGIEYEPASLLWRAKTKSTGKGGRDSSRPEEVERAVSRLLMGGQRSELSDIAEEISQIAAAALEDDVRLGTQDVHHARSGEAASVVETNRDLLHLVRTCSTSEDWGGLIEVESEKPDALLEVTAFKSVKSFRIEEIISQLKAFQAEEIVPTALVLAFERLAVLRASLLPYIAELTVSPIAFLAGKEGLISTVEDYLSTYEELLRLVSASYHDMVAAADFEAENVLSGLLQIELYVYKRENEIEVVMSPLHPLYLWRSSTIVRDVRGMGLVQSLSPREVETVEEACADNIQLLQVLVLPQQTTGRGHSIMLGQAGTIGRLPIFRSSPRGVLEPDGVRTVAEIAKRLAKLRPFARPGVQVLLVNPPRPDKFIEELLSGLEFGDHYANDTYWGVHIRIRYTQLDTRGWANDVADLNENARERLRRGEESGLVSLSVLSDIVSWSNLEKELEEEPAHLTIIIDPFEVRSTPVARAGVHDLSPWMATCEYRFNRISKEIQVVPVAEEDVFGGYLSAASLMHTSLQRKTPAHLPQVKDIKDTLENIAARSSWTVLADPHRVPIPRLGSAEIIDRRLDRGRQLTTFAHDLSPFIGRLDDQLRRTHFLATTETLEQLARDLVAMEPNGILGLASSSHEKQVKGSLGKLIAMRWYRLQQPSGLSVSLDTPNAARWLVAGNHSKEKADLLGLREENGELIIDVIEVKAHDEALPYTVRNGLIWGRAVGQALATLQALAEVFSREGASPLALPRREVLREHLYSALLRDHESDFVERWHHLLEDAFAGRVGVQLGARIVHVQLSSVAETQGRTFQTSTGVPVRVETLSAADVGLVLRSNREEERVLAIPSDGGVLSGNAATLPAREMLSRSKHLVIDHDQVVSPTEEDSPASSEPGDVKPTSHGVPFDQSEDGAEASDYVSSRDVQEASTQATSAATKPAMLEVQLGKEYSSPQEVVWSPGRQSNGFMLVLGASGSGKTETLKVLGASIHGFGIPVLTFDFHGDVVVPGSRSILLSSGSASTIGLNPMEIDAHSAEESGLYDQRASLRGMIQRAVPSLGHRQGSILREAFEVAYMQAGIVDDEPSTWKLPAPTFGDVQEILTDWASDDGRKGQRAAIEGCLAAVQQLFDHPIFRRKVHVSVDDFLANSVRLDLSKLPDSIRFVATETLLRKVFRVLRLMGPIPVQPVDDRQRFRLFVIIDEAKILSLGGGERDRADNILNELITEARKFGLGMVLASQMSEHFSEEVRANAATWIVLKPMDVKEAKKNAPNVSVDPDDLLRLAGRGDGYYRDRPSSRARRIQVNPLPAVILATS